MDTQTETKEEHKAINGTNLVLRQVDAVIEKLVNKRKDVERQLVDIKAQISVYEDEIKNAITTGQKFLDGIQHDSEPRLEEMDEFLDRCRRATQLPLALGFGVSSQEDVQFLRGKAEVAVVGSQALRILNSKGIGAVGDFFRALR